MRWAPPFPEKFQWRGVDLNAAELTAQLQPFVTEERRRRIEDVLDQRTLNILPVLESPYDRGNISAVLRSAEATGIQSVHIIKGNDKFKEANRVTRGAEKWVSVRRWTQTAECIGALKSQGYRIVATDLTAARPIGDFDFSAKTAIVFGSEGFGISPELLEMADDRMIVPMMGFTQSYNISVAAAVIFYHVLQDRLNRMGRMGDLEKPDRDFLRALYYAYSLPRRVRPLTGPVASALADEEGETFPESWENTEISEFILNPNREEKP